MQRRIYVQFVITVFLSIFLIATGEDSDNDFGITNSGAEYLPVFKNIPTLFEYLLEMLEDRPEMLEKNNINIFKRDTEDNYFTESENSYDNTNNDDADDADDNCKQSVNERNVDDPNDVTEFKASDNDRTEVDAYNEKVNPDDDESVNKYSLTKFKQPFKTKREANIYNSITENNDYKDSDDVVNENYTNDEYLRSYNNKSDIKDYVTNIDEDANEEDTTDHENDMNNSLANVDFGLTSDEVAEQAIEVEKMLEEYNTSSK